MTGTGLTIRPATEADAGAIWSLVEPVIRAGETYALDRDMDRDSAVAVWLAGDRHGFVAEDPGGPVGCYFLKANQRGGGAHVANCGYVTAAHATGRGVARAMCAHSLDIARGLGFAAMQFNFVVASNTRAVALWEAMGFATVGRLPGAFLHPRLGEVDALVMMRRL